MVLKKTCIMVYYKGMRNMLLALLFLVYPVTTAARADILTTDNFIDQNFAGALIALPVDLDRDGDMDVLGATTAGAEISWWRNDGSQAFTEYSIDGAGFNGANSLALADLNKDGELDVVFTDTNNVTWYENPGTPYTQTPWPAANRRNIAAYAGSAAVYVIDLDRDGETDIIATDGNSITWWENPGPPYTQAWTQRNISAAAAGTNALFAIDMDRDGDIDILSTDGTNVTGWINAGSPLAANNWDNQWLIDNAFNGSNSVYAVDLDRDGDNDVIATSGTGAGAMDDVAWWENTMTDATPPAAAGWTKYTIDPAFAGAASAYPVDLDFDGDLDILGAAATDNDVVWWDNNGDPKRNGWTETPVNRNFAGASYVRGADLDGDGDIDVLAAAPADNDIAWWRNDENRASGIIGFDDELRIEDFFDGASSAQAHDIDSDGDPDILATAYIGDDLTWWENDGTPVDGGWQEHRITGDFEGASRCGAVDMDRDGGVDAVAVASVDDSLSWWRNDGSESFTAVAVENPDMDNANGLAVADIDLDGDPDIAVTAGLADEISWWSNNGSPGDGGWTKAVVDASINGPTDVFCADLDRDGDMDLLACADADDDVVWYDNDGAQTFTKRFIDDNFNGARSVLAADIDSDGDPDVVACGDDGNRVSWWSNDGGATPQTWTEYTIDGSASGVRCVAAADLDHDGDIDIAGALFFGDSVVWWENDGTPEDGEWESVTIDSDYGGASSVSCHDIDMDGMIDIVATSWDDDNLSWYRNGGPDAYTEQSEASPQLGSISNTTTILEDMPKQSDLILDVEEPASEKDEYADIEEIDVKCFIATAAFGTPQAGEIHRLCEFRDEYLKRTVGGRFFIRLYEKASPPLARLIGKNNVAKKVTRALIRCALRVL